jgi:hypothetical protein
MKFRYRTRLFLLCIIALAAATAVLYHSDRKKAVESLLRKGQSAIETENIDELTTLVSPYYRDEMGFSYASLRGGFSYVFSEFNNLRVDYRIVNITAGKDTSIANLLVWTRGAWAAGTLDLTGKENDPEPVSILCKREMLKWKVIGSRWPDRKSGFSGLPGLN